MLLLATGACTGPSLRVHNPEGDRVFIDGVATEAELLPFRYYGTRRWDALPIDQLPIDHAERADFAHQPSGENFAVPPPASPWLFPFDFPLELLSRLADGSPDQDLQIAVRPTPPELHVDGETPPVELGAFVDRARRARGQR